MIHVITPFRSDKNLGKAYNHAMLLFQPGDWVCLIDHDVLFLTPDAIAIMEEYTKRFPKAGILTCFASRLHPASKGQLLGNVCSENDSIRHHIKIAEERKRDLYKVTEINNPIGGFLMLVRWATWESFPFNEDKKCLGVDNDFSKKILDAGGKILRMDGLYVWHSYRLIGGYRDKKHLL